MIRRLRFHQMADRELVALYDYLADDSGADRAWNYISAIRGFCSGLTEYPLRGTERSEIMPGLRIIGYRHSLSIAFVVDDDEIIILGLFYRGRNIDFDSLRVRLTDE